MPADSQNGHAPEPGPFPSIQPICSSALLTINPMEQIASSIAKINSAVRTVILEPAPVLFYYCSWFLNWEIGLRLLAQPVLLQSGDQLIHPINTITNFIHLLWPQHPQLQ